VFVFCGEWSGHGFVGELAGVSALCVSLLVWWCLMSSE
jgi:hypothetical protein